MSTKSYVLALDQGTTGSTAMVFDHAFNVVGRAYREFPQHYPRPGWVEHDPEDIFQSVLRTGREALQAAGIDAGQVAGLGITNQRETTILWDRKSGRPVHNAIVWQCRRSAPICEQWSRVGLAPIAREHTGLVMDAYFSSSKVAWLLSHVDDLPARAQSGEIAFGTVDTWLIWRLTNGAVHATDPSNASRTMLYDIHERDWDDDLLAGFGIPAGILPEVRPSSGSFGTAAAEHFGAEIPILGVAGDQQSALFGQGCYAPGTAKNTYGTGCFILLNTGERAVASDNRLLTTVAWSVNGKYEYALEGSVFSAGSVIQWLRDGLGILTKASDSEALATSVKDNGGVYLVPAFTGLGAPYWDMYARGTLVGMTRDTGRGHFARAALEAVAYQTRDLVEAMVRDSGQALNSMRVDGGMVANDFLMQFQADVLGVPVERPAITESTALGAACLAGLAAGVWSSLHEIKKSERVERVFEPRMSADERDALYAEWLRAVERARGWVREPATVGA
ncbi:MAG: glycerol kinase GlpK [Armatimonadetes bacterium]|nr:glycerol kinase GlpK [Armatimonadota bacterium]